MDAMILAKSEGKNVGGEERKALQLLRDLGKV